MTYSLRGQSKDKRWERVASTHYIKKHCQRLANLAIRGVRLILEPTAFEMDVLWKEWLTAKTGGVILLNKVSDLPVVTILPSCCASSYESEVIRDTTNLRRFLASHDLSHLTASDQRRFADIGAFWLPRELVE